MIRYNGPFGKIALAFPNGIEVNVLAVQKGGVGELAIMDMNTALQAPRTRTRPADINFAHLATMTYAEACAATFTPERHFVLDLESVLREMEAHTTVLDAFLPEVLTDLAEHDRGRAAAIDVAASGLWLHVRKLADRYAELRQVPAGTAPQRDERGRFVGRAA